MSHDPPSSCPPLLRRRGRDTSPERAAHRGRSRSHSRSRSRSRSRSPAGSTSSSRGPLLSLQSAMTAADVSVLVVKSEPTARYAYKVLQQSLTSVVGTVVAIGVSCEGTTTAVGKHQRTMPRAAMMVQCASLSVVVIETPLREGQLSAPLKQLLGDQAITKVFYDDGKCHVRLCAACHSALLQLQPYTIVLK